MLQLEHIEAIEKRLWSAADNLRGILPKSEYQELDNQVLGDFLRTLNPEELKKVSGDVFGRIYEYFLTQFADQKAHDGGEFFTPVSLVSLIAHVLDPESGTVLDPACGSGGMFVQSARIVEEHGDSPTEKLTFRGLEKNATTIRLAKMNLAVYGLEGEDEEGNVIHPLPEYLDAIQSLWGTLEPLRCRLVSFANHYERRSLRREGPDMKVKSAGGDTDLSEWLLNTMLANQPGNSACFV